MRFWKQGSNKENMPWEELLNSIQTNVDDDDAKECSKNMDSLSLCLNDLYMDEDKEEKLVYLIRILSNCQKKEWFVPIFGKFITFLDQDYYLKTDDIKKEIDCAFASNESYLFDLDEEFETFFKNMISRIAAFFYDKEGSGLDETSAIVTKWMILHYVFDEGNKDVLTKLKNTYPHLYKSVADIVGRVLVKEISVYEENRLVDEFVQAGKEADSSVKYPETRKEAYDFLSSIYYTDLVKTHPLKKEEAYERAKLWENVKMNDLCPCGSGKKYKKCHGIKG